MAKAKSTMKIGAHLKMEDPLAMAEATGSEVVQIFLSDPQGWKKPAPRDDAEALKRSSVPVIVHAPYIVNLASANNKIRIPSRKVLQQTMDGAAAIGATAVVVHGGHVDADDSVEAGVERWVKGLQSLETDVPLYLENTAGGDHAMARHFETIARLWDAIGSTGIGFCLDTCHAFAAGEELALAVEQILAITGRIDLVHCNDSKDPHGSGRDRHEHLGSGTIDPTILVEVVRTADAPVICETPMDGVKDDIAFLRDNL
jgi:deoxyribonuclease-4